MNTYLIPVTSSFREEEDYIFMTCSETPQGAYTNAIIRLSQSLRYNPSKDISKYESYPLELVDFSRLFSKSQKYDILYESFRHTEGFEHMAYFQVNWNNYTELLVEKAMQENWSSKTYPNNGILANYLAKTHGKLSAEKNIVIGNGYALFNTGLFTKHYDPIYAYQSGKEIQFLTGYELGGIGIMERPERANYFEKPELLLFDWHYKIDVHYPHILEDKENQKRIPKEVLESKSIINIFNGAIDTMKKRVSSNYKLAIPQYYDGKIQLLLPLCLANDDIPDMALVVTKVGNVYRGHTCLTYD